jgi:hypothetical protein
VGPEGSNDESVGGGILGEMNKDGSWLVCKGMTKYPLLSSSENLNNGEFAFLFL